MNTHPLYGEYTPGWRKVSGYESEPYEVDENCVFRRHFKGAGGEPKVEIIQTNKHTCQINLRKNKVRKPHTFYALALESFFPASQVFTRPENDTSPPSVDHMDENRENNHLNNLQHCTRAQNSRKSNQARPRESGAKRSKAVWKLENGARVQRYDSLMDAARAHNVSVGNVSVACRTGKARYGMRFEFEEAENLFEDEQWVTSPAVHAMTGLSSGFTVSNYGRFNRNGIITTGSRMQRRKYRQVIVNQTRWLAHQLVWAAFKNELPPESGSGRVIQHSDSAPLDDEGCFLNYIQYLSVSNQRDNLLAYHASNASNASNASSRAKNKRQKTTTAAAAAAAAAAAPPAPAAT